MRHVQEAGGVREGQGRQVGSHGRHGSHEEAPEGGAPFEVERVVCVRHMAFVGRVTIIYPPPEILYRVEAADGSSTHAYHAELDPVSEDRAAAYWSEKKRHSERRPHRPAANKATS